MRNTPYKALLRIEVRIVLALLICLPIAIGWSAWQGRKVKAMLKKITAFRPARIASQPLPPVVNATLPQVPVKNEPTEIIAVGIASYYHGEFHGQPTASGEVYDHNALTAAHRTYPFGTLVRVTNVENERSIVVRINDRGPHQADRLIDLSGRAARELDLLSSGTGTVKVEAP